MGYDILDAHAYSNASSDFGVVIVIDGFWRAYTLLPSWRTLNGAKDIGWAEAVGFKLLILCILRLCGSSGQQHFHVHCDNLRVVEGWCNGQSRNWATNIVFRQILSLLDNLDSHTSFHLSYIASGANPADSPSCRIFPSHNSLLPPIELPDALSPFLNDALPQFDTSSISCAYLALRWHSNLDQLDDEAEDWDFGECLWQFCSDWQD
jgi:hypothetical protein